MAQPLCILYIYTCNNFNITYYKRTAIARCDGLRERGWGTSSHQQPRIEEDQEQWKSESFCWCCATFCNCSFHKSYPTPKSWMEKGCCNPWFHPSARSHWFCSRCCCHHGEQWTDTSILHTVLPVSCSVGWFSNVPVSLCSTIKIFSSLVLVQLLCHYM